MRNQTPSKPEAIVPFLLRLPETLHKDFKAVAADHDRSMAAEIRRVLAAHVAAHSAKTEPEDIVA